jgi:hypothetical protein
MALTLTEAQTLSQNKLVKGIVEELIKESPLLARYPFVTLNGNALAINREDVDNMGSVGFHPIGGVWTESSAEFSQVTFALKVLGGDCDVDNLIQASMSNINDQMAAQVKIKTKLMAHEFEDCAIYGDASNSNEFDGLHALVASGMQVHAGSSSTGAALTLAKLDELVDMVVGGKPDLLLMNKNIRRRLTAYLRTVGSYTTGRDEFGRTWAMWGDDIPIISTDWITQTETISDGAYSAKTGGNTSSIFAIRFGEGDGLCGIQNGSIQTEYWDKLEQKDASRTRIKWYVGQALYSTTAVARLDGITDEAMSA